MGTPGRPRLPGQRDRRGRLVRGRVTCAICGVPLSDDRSTRCRACYLVEHTGPPCRCGAWKHPAALTCWRCYNVARKAPPPPRCRDCGRPISVGCERCNACAPGARRRPPRICEGCGVEFRRHVSGRDAGRFCTRECAWRSLRETTARRRAIERAAHQARVAAWKDQQLATRRAHPCEFCGRPLGDDYTGRRHRGCRGRRRRVSVRAVRVPRACIWCERPFTTITARTRTCSKRCERSFAKAKRKRGITVDTPRELIQAYRLLGLAHLAVQHRRDEVVERLTTGTATT